MFNILFLISLILLIVLNEYIYNEAASVKFTNAVCTSQNKSWVVIHKCRLNAVNRHRIDFNTHSTILHPVYNLRARVQLVKKANGYKPWLIDINFDICEFLRKRNHPFIKILYNIFRDSSNINHTCPYVGPIIVKSLYLTPKAIQLPMPTGEYGLIITWIFHGKPQAITKLYFEYIEDP